MRQTNTRKKNNLRSMIIVALLLLLVAVIGFGGYTLSKYVSNKTSDGKAQVAKWGYTLEADATNLFGKNYKYDRAASIVTTDTTGLTVASSSDAKLVAPGTTGSMKFTVSGKAEVKAALSFTFGDGAKDIVLKYTKNGVANTYKPVKWTLTKTGDEGNAVTGTLEDVANALKTTTSNYAINTQIDEEYTLSWAWAFEDATIADSNDLDTILGRLANSETITSDVYTVDAANSSTTISFEVTMVVTQLAK